MRFVVFVIITHRFPDWSETRETFPRIETIRSHSSRAGKPSNLNPVSNEMISDSVELWETAVCSLHIRLIGTNVWLPKTHNVPPEVDFESSRSPAKSESWNSPSLHCLAVLPTWQYCLYSQVWWIYEINRFKRLSQALVHFVMDRASSFTDHRISGRPIRAKYKHFRTIWEHTCDNSPTDFISSFKWWSSMQILCRVVESSCLPTHSFVDHTSLHDQPCHKTMKKYEDFEGMVISLLSPRKLKIRTWFCNCPQYPCLFRIVVECSPSIHDPRKMLVLPNRLLCWVVSTSDQDFVSFQPILWHPHTQTGIILFHDVQRDIPNLEFSPNPCFNRTFSNCLSHNSPAEGWPYRFRSRGTTGSSIQDYDLDFLCRGRRIQLSGQSDLGIFNNLWASSIFTWVLADTASAACPSQPGNLEMISLILAAVIGDAEDPCSVNTAKDLNRLSQ